MKSGRRIILLQQWLIIFNAILTVISE